ncbi:MAG: hypothetical protein JXB34_14500 [Bacteroidales bacterium]|nr:hypothetical protein [Bacteroidales bacterium]
MMKKLNYFLLGLTAFGLVFFNSCGEETVPAPSITIDNASPVAAVGGSVTLTGEIVAEGKLDEVKLYFVSATAETQIGSAYTSFSSGDITSTDNLNYNFRFKIEGLTESGKIKIEATDKENQTSARMIDVTVQAATGGEISSFTAVLIGAQSNTTYGSALDADAGTVLKLAAAADASATIDILYYYGSTNKATFVAPDDETVTGASSDFTWTSGWATKNATKFGISTMTATEFDAMNDDTELAGITGLTASKVTDQAVNDVVEFITAGGKKGAFKVSALTATNSGTVTIDVKIQK